MLYMDAEPLRLVVGAPHDVIAVGQGGWARCNLPALEDLDDLLVFVTEAEHGRFVLAEVVIQARHGVSTRLLRVVPLGRIETALNSPAIATELRRKLVTPLGETPPGMESAPQVSGRFGRGRRARPAGLALEVPPDARKPDEFYMQVAEVFAEVARTSKQPAVDLAAANEVPVTTVHRWVKEARRRGLMAPGRRSREGGKR